jgi:hypothetical protein
LSEYRAGRAQQAADTLRRLVQRSPRHGAAWADLGLYEAKLGQRAAAIDASFLAVRYGSERMRLNSYYNLWKLDVRASVPGPPVHKLGECTSVRAPAELECRESATICQDDDDHSGSGGGEVLTVLKLAAAGKDPMQDESAIRIVYAANTWISTKSCAYEWHFQPSWFHALVERCIAQNKSELECDGAVRGALEAATAPPGNPQPPHPDFALTTGEKRRARREQARCLRRLRAEEAANSGPICVPVLYDPCRKRVGLVCNDAQLEEETPTFWEPPGPRPHYVAREVNF